MTFSTLLLMPLLLGISSTLFAGNLVVNGGFEDTTQYPGESLGIRIPAGWTITDPEAAADTAVECDPFDAHSGNCAGYLANLVQLGSLSQVLSTTPGENYVLSFYLANSSQPNQIIVSWDGAELLNQTNLPDQPYTNYMYNVSATSSSTTLSFAGTNVEAAIFLDDVSVEDVGPAPEPASNLLGLAGLATLAVLKIRR